ncbi:hypothetical protein CYMTET_3773 [Cymbomonas tetramitiformis]|uniref:Uncharacterized protein n=1 Tax=Cymbomonas tetramitiformis TaxID=36881 RepID=A0AAE0H2Q3_9CHLO|nr:hypothetical protein CYMTET_3773 [Cymbomonas tetramitiformis]
MEAKDAAAATVTAGFCGRVPRARVEATSDTANFEFEDENVAIGPWLWQIFQKRSTWRIMFSWSCFFSAVYFARPFWPMLLTTYLMTVVGNSAVDYIVSIYNFARALIRKPVDTVCNVSRSESEVCSSIPDIDPRSAKILYFLFALALLLFIVFKAGPRIVYSQVPYFAEVIRSRESYSELLIKLIASIPNDEIRSHVQSKILGLTGGIEVERVADFLYQSATFLLEWSTPRLKGLTNDVLTGIFSLFVSTFVSFSIVWDGHKWKEMLQRFGEPTSRVQVFYHTLAGPVGSFSTILGQAFEVQFENAIINTILMSAGLVYLGISNVDVLAALTLVFSFIPVVGRVLSLIPTAMFAFAQCGMNKCAWVLTLGLFIWALDGFLIAPLLIGEKFKLPVPLALSALYFWEEQIGVWGLFLGIPITVFLGNVILGVTSGTYNSDEGATKELVETENELMSS